jgi:uncharacterized protein YgiM (DUF1202 family)
MSGLLRLCAYVGREIIMRLSLSRAAAAFALAALTTACQSQMADGRVDLRASPSISGDVIGKVPPGALVMLAGGKHDQWVEIRYGEQRGWMQIANLREFWGEQYEVDRE